MAEALTPLSLDKLRRLDEPFLTSTELTKALGISETKLPSMIANGILAPYKKFSSRSEVHRGRQWFSLRMLERAFWAFRERAEIGKRRWEDVRPYLLGRPESELYQTPEWFVVLGRLEEMGVNITGMRGAEEYGKQKAVSSFSSSQTPT